MTERAYMLFDVMFMYIVVLVLYRICYDDTA